jgi:hypothetical protein
VTALIGQSRPGWAAAADLSLSAVREWSQVMGRQIALLVVRLGVAGAASYLAFWAVFGVVGGFAGDARLNVMMFLQWAFIPAATTWMALLMIGVAGRFRAMTFLATALAFGLLYGLVFPPSNTLVPAAVGGVVFAAVMSSRQSTMPTIRGRGLGLLSLVVGTLAILGGCLPRPWPMFVGAVSRGRRDL